MGHQITGRISAEATGVRPALEQLEVEPIAESDHARGQIETALEAAGDLILGGLVGGQDKDVAVNITIEPLNDDGAGSILISLAGVPPGYTATAGANAKVKVTTKPAEPEPEAKQEEKKAPKGSAKK